MKLYIILIVLSFFFSLNIFAQKYDKDLFEKNFYLAESLIEKGDFEEAIKMYQDLLKMDPENANLNFKIGYCYLNTVLEKEKSIPYLRAATKDVMVDALPENHQEKAAPLDTYLYLAQAYHLNYKFQSAIDVIDTIKISMPRYKTEFVTNIDLLYEYCRNGIQLMKYPVKMFVTNLGGTINSEFDEHSPVFTADESTLIFTTKRKSSETDKTTEDGQYFEDIYISQKNPDNTWGEPVSISQNINTPGHEASIGLSVDGQELFIYEDESNMVNEKDGNIYYSKMDGDIWRKPVKLGPTINTKFNENHASISADGTELYFTSDRPGGFGGMDIYLSKKLPTGNWGEAQNLGPIINTAEDEIGPFIHPDGVTIFFSSKAHNCMGGFDIFFSSKNEEGTWDEPTNIGYPINTPSDDVFYMPTPDGRRAYYASQKVGGIGRNDIYLITLPESEEKSLTVMSGLITLADGTPPENVTITVTDIDTKEVIGVYTPNAKTGKYLFILKSDKNYNVTIDASNFLPFTENLYVKEGTAYQQIQRAVKLNPIILGEITKDYYFHFSASSTELNEKEANSLTTIAKIMKFAEQYNAEVILPKNNTNKNLNDIRAEILSQNLIDFNVNEDRVKVLKTPSGGLETLRLFIVTDKDDNLVVTNDNNNQNNQVKNDGTTPEITPVFYDFDKASTDAFNENLDKLSQWLISNEDAMVEVIGNTDQQGSDEYNLILSQKRANFVKTHLISKGVKEKSIKTKGLGESQPVAIDLNPASRKFNRRVEFKLIKEGKSPIIFKSVEVPDKYKIQ